MEQQQKEEGTIFKGILGMFLIVLLHGLVVIVLAILVFFFKGIVEYIHWILLGGTILISGSGYYFYKKIKESNKNLGAILNNPVFEGRPIEVSILGGAASIRIGQKENFTPALEANTISPSLQLEDPKSKKLRELDALVTLLENHRITQEEFEKLKQEIIMGFDAVSSIPKHDPIEEN